MATTVGKRFSHPSPTTIDTMPPSGSPTPGHPDPTAPALWPVTTEVLGQEEDGAIDSLPATYHYHETDGRLLVDDPAEDTAEFLRNELSLGGLCDMLKYLWFAGRDIVVVDRMDLHLLWTNEGKLFIKPIPRFLLDRGFCQTELQSSDMRDVALGFLYTYACLISSETDFHIANAKRLLPRDKDDTPIQWTDWKVLARSLLRIRHDNPSHIHRRFLHAELRLSRIDIIHRFMRFPRFDSYLRTRRSYGRLFSENLAWMAAVTVFIALVLTAMQVGLATERLQSNDAFQQASYGFTIFAILGPICAFALVALGALFNLAKDIPLLLERQITRGKSRRVIPSTGPESVT